MVKKSKINKKSKRYVFRFKGYRLKLILDKILIFKLIQKLHGRFWGIAAGLGLITGLTICFVIRPDLLTASTAISDFSMDVRTAPYFAGSIFFAAYGLWRWRNYLRRTIRRTRPILGLITLTIISLMLVALTPNGWHEWPSRVHFISMALVGITAAATVIFDILLSKTPHKQKANQIKLIKMAAFLLIIVGGWLTLGSSNSLEWFSVALPAEIMLMSGYFLWIILKTYQGEGQRSGLSRLLKKVILID